MGLLSGVAGVIGGIVGGKQKNDLAQDQLDFQREQWEWQKTHTVFDQLDNVSGGKFSDYMNKYAYATPYDKGKMAREQLNAQFPELNPWEMSGTGAASVASSVGLNTDQDAQKAAQAKAQIETQQSQAALQAKTAIASAQMQSRTQILDTAIKSMTDIYKQSEQNKTNLQTATIGNTPQTDIQKDLIRSQTQKNLGSTAKDYSTVQLQGAQQKQIVEQTLTELDKRYNIKMDSALKSEMANKVRYGASNAFDTPRAIANTLTDLLDTDNIKGAANTVKKVVSDVSDTVIHNAAVAGDATNSAMSDFVDKLKYVLHETDSFGDGTGVKGASSNRKTSNGRHYRPSMQ